MTKFSGCTCVILCWCCDNLFILPFKSLSNLRVMRCFPTSPESCVKHYCYYYFFLFIVIYIFIYYLIIIICMRIYPWIC